MHTHDNGHGDGEKVDWHPRRADLPADQTAQATVEAEVLEVAPLVDSEPLRSARILEPWMIMSATPR